MNIKFITGLIKKEYIQIKRDWKSLFISILISFMFFPLIIIMSWSGLQGQVKYKIYIDNNTSNIEFEQIIREYDHFDTTNNEDALIRLFINEDNYGNLIHRIEYYSNEVESTQALSILKELFEEYSKNLTRTNLDTIGIKYDEINNIKFVPTDKSPYKLGKQLLVQLFPTGLIIAIIMGGVSQGIDCIAGEKERNTIESLLLLPIKKVEVILSKYISVLLVNTLNIVIALVSFYMSTVILYLKLDDYTLLLSYKEYIYLIVVSILGAILSSAIYVLISAFSNNLKQAQAYSSICSTIFLFIIIISNINKTLNNIIYYIPILNISKLINNIILQEYTNINQILFIISCLTLFITTIVIYISSKIIQKEKYII